MRCRQASFDTQGQTGQSTATPATVAAGKAVPMPDVLSCYDVCIYEMAFERKHMCVCVIK